MAPGLGLRGIAGCARAGARPDGFPATAARAASRGAHRRRGASARRRGLERARSLLRARCNVAHLDRDRCPGARCRARGRGCARCGPERAARSGSPRRLLPASAADPRVVGDGRRAARVSQSAALRARRRRGRSARAAASSGAHRLPLLQRRHARPRPAPLRDIWIRHRRDPAVRLLSADASRRDAGAGPPRGVSGTGSALPAALLAVLAQQRRARGGQLAPAARTHVRIVQAERRQRIDDHGGDDQTAEPLVIGGYHEPGRVFGCGLADHLFVRAHVLIPVRTLAHVPGGELPVLLGLVESCEEALPLLLPGNVQEELADDRPVANQVALYIADVLETFVPDAPGHEPGRELLRLEQLVVDAHDEHLLVVRAVEDPDSTALWEGPEASPQVVVIELLLRWRLERGDVATLRVDTGKDVLDRPVLPCRIHRLEDQQHRPPILRVELVLQVREFLDALLEIVLCAILVILGKPQGVRRVDSRERDAAAAGYAIRCDQFLGGSAATGARLLLPW